MVFTFVVVLATSAECDYHQENEDWHQFFIAVRRMQIAAIAFTVELGVAVVWLLS
jgi:CHAD domain-containing protein